MQGMEKNIPTIEVEIGKGDDKKVVSIYQWMTQEEDDKHSSIILGDMEIESGSIPKGGEVKVKLTTTKLAESNKYLLKTMCKTDWEEINCWKPSLRNELLEKIREVREKN